MYKLLEELFPICRSITGEGVRKTLSIIKEIIPIDIKEVPSGTKVFDWEIPNEWNIKDAYVKDENGNRIIDYNKSNLHVVNYSIPFEGKLTLKELKNHLYTLPDQPNLIPYVTSYYVNRWGFCLSHKQYESLKDMTYEVKVDSTLEAGSLTYADLVIPGKSKKEILISTYTCHPSMANNELSGPVVTTFMAKNILEKKEKPYYTYRFVFVPETIGAITYLNKYLKHLQKNVIAGYVVTCVGDPGVFSYLKTRAEDTLVDRITLHVLENTEDEFNLYNFLARGSDERQYNAPGIDLPVGSLMRSKYHEYPEYHTSADNLDFVTDEALKQTLDRYICCLDAIDNNHIYKTTVLCEPHLSKYNLYETLGRKGDNTNTLIWNLIAYCDGKNDLLDIANKIDCPIWELYPAVETIINQGLIVKS